MKLQCLTNKKHNEFAQNANVALIYSGNGTYKKTVTLEELENDFYCNVCLGDVTNLDDNEGEDENEDDLR